jgi:hypothetical protein
MGAARLAGTIDPAGVDALELAPADMLLPMAKDAARLDGSNACADAPPGSDSC